MKLFSRSVVVLVLLLLIAGAAQASHISGIRVTQTGNTGLEINVDVTAFYTTGSTETTANLGTYYNQVPAIDWGDGATTPRYGYGPSTGIPLVATSTVVNGIPARAYRGSFSHTYGSAGSYTIRSNTACCPLTTPTYTLVSGTILTTTVTTSGPFGPTTFTTSYVQNTLAVDAVAPGFDKAFAPDTTPVGVPSTLTFTIDNAASTLDDNVLDFTDNLPAGLVVATPANVANTCTGGTLTAASGTGVVSYTGGLVAAGATCTISVDVEGFAPGAFANTSGDLTSAFGNSGPASDTLNVTAVPPTFTKAFAPNPVAVSVASTLTFTLDNTANAADATGVDFTDNLPAGLVVATPANAATTCTGGTLTAADGSTSITYTGGTIAASSTCTVTVDTSAALPGDYANTSDALTSTFGNSGTASDTLTVTATPPTFAKVFAPNPVGVDESSTLTFTLDNTANAADATNVDFTDNLPAGLVVATPANAATTCTGGTLTAADGSTSIDYTGGTIAASSTCTVTVDVTAAAAGEYANTTEDLTSDFGNSGTASDTLTVGAPPGFSKDFSPENVPSGGVSVLTFTIDNSANAFEVTDLAFTDDLPESVSIADPANVTDGCGGMVIANPGGELITYTGGTVPASSICMVSVDVTVTGGGSFENIASALTSSLGSSGDGTATATLSVLFSIDIPTMSTLGLVMLAGLLGLMAVFLVRRTRSQPRES